jgi:hypothetical protein
VCLFEDEIVGLVIYPPRGGYAGDNPGEKVENLALPASSDRFFADRQNAMGSWTALADDISN